MDYIKQYDSLINRAKNRILSGYVEKHHIIPRCMGGTDDPNNLVYLTAREHFVAHQLLVKIYKNNTRLIYAALMMCTESPTQVGRSKNRRYEWLKIRYSMAVSNNQSGASNSQYGTCWIYNLDLSESKKIPKQDLELWLDAGWIKGRRIKFDAKIVRCECCGVEFHQLTKEKYCGGDCRELAKSQQHSLFGREEEFLNLYRETGSMNKALKEMGKKGAISHYYRWAKKIIG